MLQLLRSSPMIYRQIPMVTCQTIPTRADTRQHVKQILPWQVPDSLLRRLGCVGQPSSKGAPQPGWLAAADDLPARHDVAAAGGDDALQSHVHWAERCRSSHHSCCLLSCILRCCLHRMLQYTGDTSAQS